MFVPSALPDVKSQGWKNMRDAIATENAVSYIISGIKKKMNLPFGFESDDDWLPVKGFLEKPVKPVAD